MVCHVQNADLYFDLLKWTESKYRPIIKDLISVMIIQVQVSQNRRILDRF
jgi:hypothetical protein